MRLRCAASDTNDDVSRSGAYRADTWFGHHDIDGSRCVSARGRSDLSGADDRDAGQGNAADSHGGSGRERQRCLLRCFDPTELSAT